MSDDSITAGQQCRSLLLSLHYALITHVQIQLIASYTTMMECCLLFLKHDTSVYYETKAMTRFLYYQSNTSSIHFTCKTTAFRCLIVAADVCNCVLLSQMPRDPTMRSIGGYQFGNPVLCVGDESEDVFWRYTYSHKKRFASIT